ncbi:MAG: hypothetical protein Q7S84_01960 [bacterium]|nr:hypothetical protein [bacterium]
MTSKVAVEALLKRAGIQLNGTAPGDLAMHDERFYDRVLCNLSKSDFDTSIFG